MLLLLLLEQVPTLTGPCGNADGLWCLCFTCSGVSLCGRGSGELQPSTRGRLWEKSIGSRSWRLAVMISPYSEPAGLLKIG